MQVWVVTAAGTTELAIELLLTDVLYTGTILNDLMTLYFEIDRVYINKITIVDSTFNLITTAASLKFELNSAFKLFLPEINTIIKAHPLTVPSELFGIFTLSNLEIGFFNNYFYLGATPFFLPPAAVQPVMEQLLIIQ